MNPAMRRGQVACPQCQRDPLHSSSPRARVSQGVCPPPQSSISAAILVRRRPPRADRDDPRSMPETNSSRFRAAAYKTRGWAHPELVRRSAQPLVRRSRPLSARLRCRLRSRRRSAAAPRHIRCDVVCQRGPTRAGTSQQQAPLHCAAQEDDHERSCEFHPAAIRRNNEGQDLLEYALLVALIAIVAVAAITAAGAAVQARSRRSRRPSSQRGHQGAQGRGQSPGADCAPCAAGE